MKKFLLIVILHTAVAFGIGFWAGRESKPAEIRRVRAEQPVLHIPTINQETTVL